MMAECVGPCKTIPTPVGVIILIVCYVASVVWNTGVLCADFQHQFDASDESLNKIEIDLTRKFYRSDLAMSFAIGLIPIVGTIVALFVTGFYEHGWQITRRPDIR